jgi:hypothetical protein
MCSPFVYYLATPRCISLYLYSLKHVQSFAVVSIRSVVRFRCVKIYRARTDILWGGIRGDGQAYTLTLQKLR